MSKRDYYEILGVSKGVDAAELKKAYRRLAMKFHPDRNPGDEKAEAKFKEAKEAYDVISDADKRAAYDQFGHAAFEGGMGGGAGGFGGAAGAGGFGDIFGDMFGDIFGGGGGGGRQRQRRGADLRYNLELTLEDAEVVVLVLKPGQSLGHRHLSVALVTVRVRYEFNRVFSLFSKPARNATVAVRLFLTLVMIVMGRGE